MDKQTAASNAGTYAAAAPAAALTDRASMSTTAGNGPYNYPDSAPSSDPALGFLSATNGIVTGNFYAAPTNFDRWWQRCLDRLSGLACFHVQWTRVAAPTLQGSA